VKTKELFQKRFDELADHIDAINASKFETTTGRSTPKTTRVQADIFTTWRIRVQALISDVCGEESEYFREYKKIVDTANFQNYYEVFLLLKSTFLATKQDFEEGYLSKLKSLIQSEVFEDELEQAEELFKNGYVTAAAVIAGVVLETGIRELCDRNSIPFEKLDKMNADLAKAGVYNKLTQKHWSLLKASVSSWPQLGIVSGNP
jgi:hypothetical protein